MENNEKKNKRIAKNTLFLYFRMLFLMVITLYTSRVILASLGVEDYGIYNVVGGIVAMFAILSKSLSHAISRFLNYEMGRENLEKLDRTFSTSITILTGIALLVALLTEIGGYWWLNNKMVIPEDRILAANWVFQFSIIAFVIDLISVPYNAAIIAHEKMSAFAYISIYEGVAKLIVSFLVGFSPIDCLVFYALLLLLINISLRVIYGIYCGRNFSECNYHLFFDKPLMKEIFSYSGWTFIGNSAAILKNQGGNMLLNLFFGPTVNAARAIAIQVDNAVVGFSQNFMTAVKPQITKSYASGDKKYMMKLIFQSARFSYYLLFFMSLPVMINTDYILHVWLKEVPEHSVMFVNLTLIAMIIDTVSHPLIIANNATGRIRNYQLIVGGIQLLNLPFSYILLKIGYQPEYVFFVAVFLNIVSLLVRLSMLKKQIQLDVLLFTHKVILNVLLVTITSSIIPIIMIVIIDATFLNFIISCFVCFVCTLISVFFIGCSHTERSLVINQFNKFISKNH